jgi:type II secretory ATPase GspE/PulE/Tfp pilus assembly ATPase PilB-like protein
VNAVLAQRLVRKICPHCKQPSDKVLDSQAAYLKRIGVTLPTAFKGTGCDKCRQSGYKGRMGIYEFLELNEALRDVISSNPSLIELRRATKAANMMSLQEDGLLKVAQGTTTLDEIMRVTET